MFLENKKAWFCLVAMTAVLLSSCTRPDYVKADSYVIEYDDIQSYSFSSGPDGIFFVTLQLPVHYSIIGDEENLARFEELRRKHNDYSRKHSVGSVVGEFRNFEQEGFAYAVDFTGISVTSDADFDDAHPAGSSLADIMEVSFVDNISYINSGYKKGLKNQTRTIRLSELNQTDLTAAYRLRLSFTTAPSRATSQTLTIILTDDSDNSYTYTVDYPYKGK